MSSARTAIPRVSTLATAVVIALAAPIALGQQNPAAGGGAQPAAQPQDGLEEIVVFGRNLELVGTAEAASEGTVGGADLLVRPMLRVAELLEAVPGMVAVQHSGSGKANQYFLRGFNLDHGTDFTTYVDGVPWNLRSHGHGQGYLDVNGLMPETVERIDYRKGPYRADTGDFAMAGASFITTIDRLDAPFAALESGEGGWLRLAGGGTMELDDDATLTGLIEHQNYDGPWELQEGLEHTSVWGKYRRPTDFGTLAVTVVGLRRQLASHRADSRARDRHRQSARTRSARSTRRRTAIRALDRRGAARGRSVASVGLRAVLRLVHVSRIRPTTFRSISSTSVGRRAAATSARSLETDKLTLTVGGEFRYDDIGNVGLDEFDAGEFVANISQNSIQETSLGVFIEASWSLDRSLARLTGGLRGDTYDFDATAKISRQLRRARDGFARVAEGRRRVHGQRQRRALRQLGRGLPLERRARCRQSRRPDRGARRPARVTRPARASSSAP